MALLTKRLIRIPGIVDQQFPGTMQDQRTSQTPQIVRGNACRFEFGFFNKDNEVFDLEDVESLNIKIKDSRTVNTLLADQTIDAGDLDLSVTLESWTDGTKQHAAFDFTNAEMNLDPQGEQRTLWLVVTAILTDGSEHTLCAGNLHLEEDNNNTAGAPPENPGTELTLEQADARYGVTVIDDVPLRMATGMITVVGNTSASWSLICGDGSASESAPSYANTTAGAAGRAALINADPDFPFTAYNVANVIHLVAKAPGTAGNVSFTLFGSDLSIESDSLSGGLLVESGRLGELVQTTVGSNPYTFRSTGTGEDSNWEGATGGVLFNSTTGDWRRLALSGADGSESLSTTAL